VGKGSGVGVAVEMGVGVWVGGGVSVSVGVIVTTGDVAIGVGVAVKAAGATVAGGVAVGSGVDRNNLYTDSAAPTHKMRTMNPTTIIQVTFTRCLAINLEYSSMTTPPHVPK
jgi:hypothetical protein